MSGKARLAGSVLHPELHIKGAADKVFRAIKVADGHHDDEAGYWVVRGPGCNPAGWLGDIGVERYSIAIDDVSSIDDVTSPIAGMAGGRPLVLPRLTGRRLCEALLADLDATWDADRGGYRLPLWQARHLDACGVELSPKLAGLMGWLPERTAALAASDTHEGFDDVIGLVGDIPSWFGQALDPYQRAGAIAVVAGHRLLADEMGLGKSRQALAAASIADATRTIIVCPPVVVSSWRREVEESHVADPSRNGPGEIVTFVSGRKEPDLPDHGVVVVPDTLLAARDHLVPLFLDWDPHVAIVDEIHRAKTWTAQRSRAVRDLCEGVPMAVGVTGTPLFANPVELASPMEAVGLLGPTFGGYGAFTKAFARQGRYKRWHPVKRELPRLRAMLNSHVWVRRDKATVQTNLPSKRRMAHWVDVDLKGFRKAHKDVDAKIDKWLAGFDSEPTEDEIDEFCDGDDALALLSPLRRAAGLAKVDAAVDYIVDWVESTTETTESGGKIYHRPLIVWTHHKEVSDAMAAAVPEAVGSSEVIVGATGAEKRGDIVDRFQAGQVSVLVASIHAAGVGITLTRGSDMVFVETDWTPALVAQAEDRANRRGATKTTIITTMLAEGTLDEQVQRVLARKIQVLDDVLGGGDHAVAVASEEDDDLSSVSDIIRKMVDDRIKSYRFPKSTAMAA